MLVKGSMFNGGSPVVYMRRVFDGNQKHPKHQMWIIIAKRKTKLRRNHTEVLIFEENKKERGRATPLLVLLIRVAYRQEIASIKSKWIHHALVKGIITQVSQKVTNNNKLTVSNCISI